MSSSNKTGLVTGATGYIGEKLCESLLEVGWSVHVITRPSGGELSAKLRKRVFSHNYDDTFESLVTAVSTSQPNVVFHLASLFIAEHRTEQVPDLIASNVLFGTQLAEACVRKGVGCFVNTGTSWQHYHTDAYSPVCLYAATKQAFEDILDFYADAFDLNVITLKISDTYGPDDRRPKLVNLLLKVAETGELLGMSPGEQQIDLVHIDDVVSAFSLAATRLIAGENQRKHERYAVSTGQPVSVCELVRLISEVTDKKLNVVFGNRPYRPREVMRAWKSCDWLPGWMPEAISAARFKEIINRKITSDY